MSNRAAASHLRTQPNFITVEPLGPVIGALISGVDLSRPIDADGRAEIGEALLKHKVLFFEDQIITPLQQRNFAAAFGKLHVHPIYPQIRDVPEVLILDTHAGNIPDNDTWHTDVTFIETPPLGAVLYAKELPPSGGDTLWVNNQAAFEALSPDFRAFLQRLSATHDFEKSFPRDRYARNPAEEKKWLETRAKNKPVTHPVIRTHPVTGAKGLFVNEGFTTRINELSASESRTVLDLLFAHIQKPDFQVRWRWKPNSVAMWDNRITQHYAVADYLPHRRIMHRATILGDRPC